MLEDIFKEFSPEEIAKAYEELCDELCHKIDPEIGSVNNLCCDDEANEIDALNTSLDLDYNELQNTSVAASDDGDIRANSIIACMSSVESQLAEMTKNTSKMTDLINLKYSIEELYYHYLILGQYYEGKHLFVKYMQNELSAGGTRANNAQRHFKTALDYNPQKGLLSGLSFNNSDLETLKNFTDQAGLFYNNGMAQLEIRLNAGLGNESLLPKTYRDYQMDNQLVIFKNKSRQNNGLLYDTYLDAAAHLDDIFTLQERGLSSDTPDPTLAGTGAEAYMDKYVGDLIVFNEFHSKFKQNFEDKILIRRNDLPQLVANAGAILRKQAEHEAASVISLSGYKYALDWSITQGVYYNDKINQIKLDLVWVEAEIKNTEEDLMSGGKSITDITCLGNAALDPDPDPLKANAPIFDKGVSEGLDYTDTISLPNLTDMAYWRRFATIATLVGLLPLPGPGLFRYWPIGLILPPAIRIPLPIIWLPIKAIPTPFGVFVFFIGLSGIFPSPFLFFISPTGQKSFLISITPTLPFGTDSSKPPVKGISAGGISFQAPIFKNKEIQSNESSKNMVGAFVSKIKNRISIKQTDLVAYNTAADKSVVIKDIVLRDGGGMDFSWTYPAGSAKSNPKTSDAQTLKDTTVGDAKSALAGISILGKLKKIQAPKLSFGPKQLAVKVKTSDILGVITEKLDTTNITVPETSEDLKTIIAESIEGSVTDVTSHFETVLKAGDNLQNISPKTIPEVLKLPKLEFSTSTVTEIDPVILATAKKAVAAISLIPYPAVAFLPQLFMELHPILSNDDLPPWERLSLKNFLFVAFLDSFCKTGKMGSLMPV